MIKVWRHERERSSDEFDVYMSRLRNKLEANPSQPRMLITIGLAVQLRYKEQNLGK